MGQDDKKSTAPDSLASDAHGTQPRPRDAAFYIQTITDLASDILALDQSSEELLVKFDAYTELFDEWRLKPGGRFEKDLSLPGGRGLAELHAQVLSKAQAVRGVMAEELRSLKRHGKGILAYTDILPKRLSTIRPRKG